MNQTTLLEQHHKLVRQVAYREACRWYVPWYDREDIIQDVFLSLMKSPIDKTGLRDPLAYVSGVTRLQAGRTLWDYRGFDNKHPGKKTARAEGEQATHPVGLYQERRSEEANPLDERILPTMASAEDQFFASLPTRRQEALRGAIEGLAPRQREALKLRFYEELEVPAVASRMGLTYDQTSRAISEGVANLRKKLNPGQPSYPKAVMSNGKGQRE